MNAKHKQNKQTSRLRRLKLKANPTEQQLNRIKELSK